jgi:spermidine/putrescine-binding protein
MTLRMVVWRGYDDREAAAPFLAEHGISLDVVYVDDEDETLDLLNEGELGRVDLIAIDNRYLPAFLAAELLTPVEDARLSNATDLIRTFTRFCRDGGTNWSVPYIWGRQPIPYNPAFVSEPPTSWLDVLKPEYRGKVAMVDAASHQIIVWGRVLGYPDPARITREQLREVIGLSTRVKRESRARLVGWDDIPVLLASGEAWIATGGWEAVARFAAALGAEVRLSYPSEDPYPWLDSWCIPRGAPHEDVAYAWIDWMIGPETQAIVCRNLPCGTVNRRAVALLDPDVRAGFPHERIDELFAPGLYVGLPPLNDEEGLATLAHWHEAWEEVRAA